jgi:hypothetical protein
LVPIHSPSSVSAMTYQSGTFYFAERGTSHIAATLSYPALTKNSERLEYPTISIVRIPA